MMRAADDTIAKWKADEGLKKCDHMTCTNCKYEFCRMCGADRSAAEAHGNHYHLPGCVTMSVEPGKHAPIYFAWEGKDEYKGFFTDGPKKGKPHCVLCAKTKEATRDGEHLYAGGKVGKHNVASPRGSRPSLANCHLSLIEHEGTTKIWSGLDAIVVSFEYLAPHHH